MNGKSRGHIDLNVYQMANELMSAHKVHYLRYACSQNDHLRNVNSHFSIYASLDSELSESDNEFIDRLELALKIFTISNYFLKVKKSHAIIATCYCHCYLTLLLKRRSM